MRHLPQLLLALLLCSSLSACAKVRIEDDPAEQAKATALAEKYLKSFAEGNDLLALEMSETPFWGDGVVLMTRDELKVELAKQLKDVKGLEFKVVNPRFLAIEEVKLLMPNLYRALTTSKFTEDVHAVAVTLEFKDRTETGLVLVRRLENGFWKVIGIGD